MDHSSRHSGPPLTKSPPHRSLARVLESEAQFADGPTRHRQEAALTQSLRKHLPRPIAERVRVTDTRDGVLELAATAGAIAATLRQRAPDLRAALAARRMGLYGNPRAGPSCREAAPRGKTACVNGIAAMRAAVRAGGSAARRAAESCADALVAPRARPLDILSRGMTMHDAVGDTRSLQQRREDRTSSARRRTTAGSPAAPAR